MKSHPSIPEYRIQNLRDYAAHGFERGAPKFLELCWILTSLLTLESGLPFPSFVKTSLLRFFGAHIGRGVVIKPRVQVKFPWKLWIGDWCWIGEGVWIDNLDHVEIRECSCLSQDAYLCTGSHDHRSVSFALKTAPIFVGREAWIGARVTLLPGTRVEDNSVVAAGSVVTKTVISDSLYAGVPARRIGPRLPGDTA